MILIGLTGSIGMGKSTVAGMFRAAGVPVFDADATVHRLQGPGGALLPAIEAAFPGTTGPKGVDRAALGRAVFGNRAALGRLEAIVHPLVRDVTDRKAALTAEKTFIRSFEYADAPGYAVVTVRDGEVRAQLFAGLGRRPWKTVDLAALPAV